MKLIFISGPTGSGKSTLSNQIIYKIKNGIVLRTDNYYKTGLKSKLTSQFVEGYFDRIISFNHKLFKKDFDYILNKKTSIYERSYNFEKKTTKKYLKERSNINYLIVEGIFAKEFASTLCDQNYFLLELKISKSECMKRVLQRDIKERGKSKKKASNDFIKSWNIYYEKYEQKNIDEFTITKETNIEKILKKIFTNY